MFLSLTHPDKCCAIEPSFRLSPRKRRRRKKKKFLTFFPNAILMARFVLVDCRIGHLCLTLLLTLKLRTARRTGLLRF